MKFTVILADDEPYILEGLKKRVDWLELGFQIVATASNGPECLEMIEIHQPDLIITDIRMPGFTGLDLVAKIQNLDNKSEVILISGYSEFDYAKRALEMGVQSYLLKPIAKEELKTTLLKVRNKISKKKDLNKNAYIRKTKQLLELLDSTNISKSNESLVLKKTGLSGKYENYICLAATDSLTVIENALTSVKTQTSLHFFNFDYDMNIILIEINSLSQQQVYKLIKTAKLTGEIGISSTADSILNLSRIIDEAVSAFHFAGFRSIPVYKYNQTDSELYKSLINKTEMFSVEKINSCNSKFFSVIRKLLNNHSLGPEIILSFYNYSASMLNMIIVSEDLPITPLSQFSSLHQLAKIFKSIDSMVGIIESVTEQLSSLLYKNDNLADMPNIIIQRTLRFINSNFTLDLSLSEIADKVRTDSKYLSAIFIKKHGSTILEYIRYKRIEHAKFLLNNSDLNMNEIAESCGYKDYYYFAKVFKKETGITASDYRETGPSPSPHY